MKKKNTISYIVIFSLSFILALSLVGCGKNKEKADTTETNVEANSDTDKNDSESEDTDENSDDESEITEEDFNTFTEFNDNLVDIEESKYLNDDGYVDEDNVTLLLDEVEKTVEQGVSDGLIDHYTRDDDNIFIVYESGITNLFIPYQEDTLSGGGSVGKSFAIIASHMSRPDTRKKIITVEPVKDSWMVSSSYSIAQIDAINDENIKTKENLYPKASANFIVNTEPGKYKYEDSLINDEVTVDSVKNLGEYDVIIWEGHGAYNEELHSALVTGEDASIWDYWKMGSSYVVNDMLEHRVTTTTLKDGPLHFVITSKFIDEYVGSMQGALVFLGTCSSFKDDELANSFINKGAYAVFGYTDIVKPYYEMYSRAVLFNELTTKGEDDQYKTIDEAYQNTYNKVGKCKNGCIITGLTATDDLKERYTIAGLLPKSKEQDIQNQDAQEETNSSDEESIVEDDNSLTIENLSGDWTLDSEYTMNVNNKSIMDFYGTSFNGSNPKMTFSSDGSFQYYIAWCYGNGTFELQNDEIITNISDGDPLQGEQTLIITTDNGITRIGLDQYGDGSYIFWKKS